MSRLRFSGELALPFLTIGFAFIIYSILMAANLLSIQGDLRPLTNSQEIVARLKTQNLETLADDYSGSQIKLDRLSESLKPFRWIGQNMRAVPIVSASSRAVSNLVARLADDLRVFESTIRSVSRADELVSLSTSSWDSESSLGHQELVAEINLLKERWSEDLETIRLAESKNPSSWPIESQFARIAAAENELADVSEWGIHLLESAAGLVTLSADVDQIFSSIDNFEQSIVASDQLVSSLEDLKIRTTSERESFERTIADTPVLLNSLPAVQQLDSLLEAVKVAEGAITGLSILANNFSEIANRMGDRITGTLTPEGPIELLAVEISANSDDINTAAILLNGANKNSNALAKFLSESTSEQFESIIRKSARFTTTLATIAPILPELVGVGESTEYLVLGQTTDELRANGGFVSSAWELEFHNGGIASVVYKNVLTVDDLNNLENYPSPPEALKNHMNAPVWLIRDTTWNPDFPSAATTAIGLYELGQGKRLSQVMGINTFAIIRIVEAIGGIDVRGERITSNDITRIIETETDEYGTVYLQVVFDSILRELASPKTRGELARFSLAVLRALEAKEIIIYSTDEQIGAALRTAKWDGSIESGLGSRYYVVDSNIGWNKVDRNIVRSTSYNIDLQTDGSAKVKMVASYENRSGDHPPFLNCDKQWHPLTTVYAALQNGCYWNYIQIFGPVGSKITQADAMALPDGAAYVEFGNGLPSEPTLNITSTPFGPMAQGLIAIPKDGFRELVFEFAEPNAWDPDGEPSAYDLEIRSQPGIKIRSTDVVFNVPDGYRLVESRSIPHIAGNAIGQYSFELSQDTTFHIELAAN